MKKNMFIKINNGIVRNKMISENAKLIFTLISANENIGTGHGVFCTSVSGMIHMLKGAYGTRTINKYKSAIKELVDFGIITLYSDMTYENSIDVEGLKANDWFYSKINHSFIESRDFIKQFDFEKMDEIIFENCKYKSFTSIYLEDIIKFLNLDMSDEGLKNVNKAKLLSVYLVILSKANLDSLNKDSLSGINFESVEVMARYANASKNAITEYINILCNIKMIFKVKVMKSSISGISAKSIYARWRDRDNLLKALDVERSGLPFNYTKVMSINNIEITNEQSEKILAKIFNTKEINDKWVDDEILKKIA